MEIDVNKLMEISRQMESLITPEVVSDLIDETTMPFRELMSYYKCAIMEVETKFNVLNEEFALGNDCNPIAYIKTRLKSPRSIVEKMNKLKVIPTTEAVESSLHDVAGVRVVCHYLSDIYRLADALLAQDDVTLFERKDYIIDPKPNGYRSLHLIISTPIFLHDKKRMMKVEVQFRTLAMDTWASQEHQMRYKKCNTQALEAHAKDLLECANMCAKVDSIMDNIHLDCLNG